MTPQLPRRGRRRRTRLRAMRSQTMAIRRMTRDVMREGALEVWQELSTLDATRPRTRGDCLEGGSNAQRPCPYVGCKHHLYLDVNPHTGSITINFPDIEPEDLEHCCALDVAENGGMTLEEVGDLLNVTRERARQIEVRGLVLLRPTFDDGDH